jgi:hypothetical protein
MQDLSEAQPPTGGTVSARLMQRARLPRRRIFF